VTKPPKRVVDSLAQLNKNLKHRYGISADDRLELLKKQGGRCACCGNCDPGSKFGWHIDHCHNSKQVRGVLCAPCNTSIGHVKESIPRLKAMISYLRKHQT
jgi:hypothetical protein